jgi:hypothetical protein
MQEPRTAAVVLGMTGGIVRWGPVVQNSCLLAAHTLQAVAWGEVEEVGCSSKEGTATARCRRLGPEVSTMRWDRMVRRTHRAAVERKGRGCGPAAQDCPGVAGMAGDIRPSERASKWRCRNKDVAVIQGEDKDRDRWWQGICLRWGRTQKGDDEGEQAMEGCIKVDGAYLLATSPTWVRLVLRLTGLAGSVSATTEKGRARVYSRIRLAGPGEGIRQEHRLLRRVSMRAVPKISRRSRPGQE